MANSLFVGLLVRMEMRADMRLLAALEDPRCNRVDWDSFGGFSHNFVECGWKGNGG